MKEGLSVATDNAVILINWATLIVIVVGAVEAFFRGVRAKFASVDSHVSPDVWLCLGRWLVAGLTFQLAAAILETAVSMSWVEVARLAAIAAIRTSLNFFLERERGGGGAEARGVSGRWVEQRFMIVVARSCIQRKRLAATGWLLGCSLVAAARQRTPAAAQEVGNAAAASGRTRQTQIRARDRKAMFSRVSA